MSEKTLYKSIIREALESICEGAPSQNDVAVSGAKADIMNRFFGNEKTGEKGIMSTNTPTAQRIRDVGRNIGVNVDYNSAVAGKIRSKSVDQNMEFTDEMMNDVKKVIPILQKYIQKSSAAGAGYTVNYHKMAQDLPQSEVDFVAKMQDFIDMQGLEWTYNPSIKKTSSSKTYGITADKDGDVNMDNFSFNVAFDSPEFQKYKKEALGTFAYIPIDEVPVEFMDEIVSLPAVPVNDSRKGISVDLDSPTYIEVAGRYYVLTGTKDGKILTDAEIKQKMFTSVLDKYMMAKYGIAPSLPVSTFATGNAKLPNSTLIINFTSAQRCPAWGECLVKNACYARAGEKLHYNVFQANSQRNLMWEAGLADPEMMVLIENLLRTYIIDYSVARRALTAARKNIGERKVTAKTVPSVDVLRKLRFSEYSPEELDIVKTANRGIKNIRLNENGDFINNALLQKIDEICGDIALVGVRASAYTCRTLQFDKIKNIIINASRDNIQGPTVARYFIALPEKIYDAFDDTYNGPGNTIDIKSKEEVLKPNPQPLYFVQGEEKVPTGKLYYKCPCGRGFNGKAHETLEAKKINCYQCNICYEPSDKPYYVFVRVHGGAAAKLEEKPLKYGESANFRSNYLAMNKKEYVPPIQKDKNGGYSLVNEIFNIASREDNDEYGIQCVTDNAIFSVNDHLAELFAAQNKMLQETKDNFKTTLDRLNNVEF